MIQSSSQQEQILDSARRTIAMELQAIVTVEQRIGEDFVKACDLILRSRGRVIVSGMGKSGHIGHKIAATLASTGTPAFFVHPGEASHGDLGMITHEDIVLAISNSGNSSELITLLPTLKRRGIPLIAFTGKPLSPLAVAADVVVDIGVHCEACPLDLAPTSSTTVTLVIGDALAVALLEARGFTAEEFALSHPGGTLGKRLLLRVEDIMHRGVRIPSVPPNTMLLDALAEMSAKSFGMTTVLSPDNHLLGVFTDGDLRRALDKGMDIRSLSIQQVMSVKPTTIKNDLLAAEALAIMEKRKITALVVTDADGAVCGILHMHDLLRAGIA